MIQIGFSEEQPLFQFKDMIFKKFLNYKIKFKWVVLILTFVEVKTLWALKNWNFFGILKGGGGNIDYEYWLSELG